jgi:hypothetical protein
MSSEFVRYSLEGNMTMNSEPLELITKTGLKTNRRTQDGNKKANVIIQATNKRKWQVIFPISLRQYGLII